MTLFHVGGLLQEPPGGVRVHRLEDHYLQLGPEIDLAGPVNGEIRMQRTNRGIVVDGTVDAILRRTCVRCLEAFEEELRLDLAEEFVPSIDLRSGNLLPAPDRGEAALTIDAHHQLDLAPVLREELVLREPMHPLCRPDCPGLCPGCGRNLGAGSCDCERNEMDPRLAMLGRLMVARPRPPQDGEEG
jgi:uncharacterized protein